MICCASLLMIEIQILIFNETKDGEKTLILKLNIFNHALVFLRLSVKKKYGYSLYMYLYLYFN